MIKLICFVWKFEMWCKMLCGRNNLKRNKLLIIFLIVNLVLVFDFFYWFILEINKIINVFLYSLDKGIK